MKTVTSYVATLNRVVLPALSVNLNLQKIQVLDELNVGAE